eukprot:3192049-Rhodomonas_salina.1
MLLDDRVRLPFLILLQTSCRRRCSQRVKRIRGTFSQPQQEPSQLLLQCLEFGIFLLFSTYPRDKRRLSAQHAEHQRFATEVTQPKPKPLFNQLCPGVTEH